MRKNKLLEWAFLMRIFFFYYQSGRENLVGNIYVKRWDFSKLQSHFFKLFIQRCFNSGRSSIWMLSPSIIFASRFCSLMTHAAVQLQWLHVARWSFFFFFPLPMNASLWCLSWVFSGNLAFVAPLTNARMNKFTTILIKQKSSAFSSSPPKIWKCSPTTPQVRHCGRQSNFIGCPSASIQTPPPSSDCTWSSPPRGCFKFCCCR